jgi:hypothetical protein
MSKYLSAFQREHRITADPELVQRWEWDARYNGDKSIKIQLAHAKRTATSLLKAGSQFTNIKPEQELAIRAAASAMRTLAEQLSVLATWAKKYKAFCEKQFELEEIARLEDFADKRWGASPDAFLFEYELVTELQSKEGQLQFAEWMHTTGRLLDVDVENLTCEINRYGERNQFKLPKLRLAKILKDAQQDWPEEDHVWTGFGGHRVAVCKSNRYEQYLAYRKDIALKASTFVKSMSHRSSAIS